MNVGLPGTGLAGLFYLATALLMPLLELARTLAGRSSVARWRLVALQSGLALGVIGGLWATAWVLNRVLPDWVRVLLRAAGRQIGDGLGLAPTLVTFGTLAAVLLVTEVLQLFLARDTRGRQTVSVAITGESDPG